MTTTISFATRDCVALGCDSLVTSVRNMISPFDLIEKYYEVVDGEYTFKNDDAGIPLLNDVAKLFEVVEELPYNQAADVTKIFQLSPLPMGMLFAGVVNIGDHSIRFLRDKFINDPKVKEYIKGSYTVWGVSERLRKHIKQFYDKQFSKSKSPPDLEIIVSGFSKNGDQPEIMKFEFGENAKNKVQRECERGVKKIVFGGQYDAAHRVVYGVDYKGYMKYILRVRRLFETYRNEAIKKSAENGVKVELPDVTTFLQKENAFKAFANGIGLDLTGFSEQGAINIVHFLVDLMIKTQHFSNQLQTVGGKIHIALITKQGGFQWISPEEYLYEGKGVPRDVS